MKKLFFAIAILLLQLDGSAQEKVKFKFTSINEVGLLQGQSGSAFQLQIINGVSYKTFSGGIGIGMDNYYLKTIPLFFDIRKNFSKNVFAYVDAGVNFPWNKKDLENKIVVEGTYSKGLYLDAGAGYLINFKKTGKLLLSIGYSEKQIKENADPNVIVEPSPPSHYTNYYKYIFQRLTMKIGLSI
jgi:hypothetical protein